ncbi:MAG: DMT family transporter [Candidatus Desulfovibrio faecigallinarum]|nr:DMT family transporter [Candidatus Desulfovibrio faecigallinarum]
MKYKQELALCLITMIWGATFIVIRMAMESCGPLFFVGLRFGTAALILLGLSSPILRGLTREEVVGGALLGCIVFTGFALQTAGLASLDAAKSAFLTAFYVPLVPLIEWLFLKRRPSARSFVSLALAFVGVVLLSGGFKLHFEASRGELLTLLCSLIFALEIVCTGILAPRSNARRLAFVEVLVTSLLSFALMPVTGESVPDFSWFVVLAACGLGLSTALIQSVMVWAQKTVPPSRATLIYTGEPVWGGIFGYMAGERLSPAALLGCGLVVSGLLFGIGRKKEKRDEEAVG